MDSFHLPVSISPLPTLSLTLFFLSLSPSIILRVVLGNDDIVDCDEAQLFEATARWLEHCPAERENHDNICLTLLKLVRFPIMDSCLLSDVIKGHPLMVGAERTNLLLEAFEHHALRYVQCTVLTLVSYFYESIL